MNHRMLGKTGLKISEVSLGTWQLGGKWGEVFDDQLARTILEKAYENGVNFFDTADVYNNGLSEKAIGEFLKTKQDKIYVATKCGRGLNPHNAQGYNAGNIRKFIEASLKRMDLERLDLIQLHCPPTDVYYKPEVFDELEKLKGEGKIAHYGVSVERVEEALKAMEYPGVETVQIIFNMFRQRPSELFFDQAKKKDIGVIVRVPLASGLLTGKFNKDTVFNKDDHRFNNRDGQHFDKGETFAGVNYEQGLKAVEKLKDVFGGHEMIASYALKWILMFPQVSCVIPGASSPKHIEANIAAAKLPDLTDEQMQAVRQVYNNFIKASVHHNW